MMKNFDIPYMSKSIREFWRRWHISLSSWFRDYLYFPLGGSRTSTVKRYRNLVIVFLVSGIWHGANWTFLAWGLWHGFLQVIEICLEKARAQMGFSKKERGLGCILMTFFWVSLGWILFRADSLSDAFNMIYYAVYNFNLIDALNSENLFSLGLDAKNWNLLIVSLVILICVDVLKYNGVSVKQWYLKQNTLIKDIIIVAMISCIAIAGIWGNGYDAANFIYTQF